MEKKSWLSKLEDLDEDQTREGKNPRRKQFGLGRPPDNLISYIAGGAGIVLVIILVVIFARGGGDVSSKEIQELSDRLDAMDQRLQDIEQQSQERQLAVSETWTHSQDLNRRLEVQRENIDDMRQQLAALKKEAPAAPARQPDPQPVQRPQPAEEPDTEDEHDYHEVQVGENLFRIGLKYGLSADELRKMNDLGPDEPIHPGQKLRVSR
ncbi:LysM peptidoglycan-binding domain-containing protein [Desulfonatronospira sp.]|uniref:LysM peptidoglycan-binding domain-containing protein n=1 Tax=Desulfonatronospira sp. TaxID=1962951 RepID=UPI0025BBCBA8|nr:LysM peptidoglycan-binding domain-containing protein [Desulfonatronospira sp.]